MDIQAGFRAILCAGLVAGLAQPAFGDEAPGKDGYAGHLKVMTQNLYVGADLFKILDGEPGDFYQRAEAIADLVAKAQPHLIGLQEVSLIRTQCPDDIVLPPGNPLPNATDVYADYLQILMNALNARGLDYEVVTTATDVDVELPVANLGLLTDCPFPLFDARLTDRDVTLKRGDVAVDFAASGNFQANFPVPTPAGPIVFTRGYNIVDVTLDMRQYRFVNTHLEVDGNPFANGFQFAQAFELTQVLDGLVPIIGDRIVVMVGDFNSDPVLGPTVPCMLPPNFDTLGQCPTSYAWIAGSGFTDTWTIRNGAGDVGFTCCQDDLLVSDDPELYRRIDHVWLRPPVAGAAGPEFVRAAHVTVVGDREQDRSAGWLWPSDHAGVVAGMTIRQAK